MGSGISQPEGADSFNNIMSSVENDKGAKTQFNSMISSAGSTNQGETTVRNFLDDVGQDQGAVSIRCSEPFQGIKPIHSSNPPIRPLH